MAFVPPPYPHDRLGPVRAAAAAVPGGMVDASVGTPVDPMPDVVVRALADAAPGATGYPATIGSPALREAAAAWIERRFGCAVTTDEVVPCIGTKELVASLPRVLSLRDPSRDTVLYPAVAYPTYEMGALLGGLRPVPVPVDDELAPRPRRGSTPPTPRGRWCSGSTTRATPPASPPPPLGCGTRSSGRAARGVVVASDECYAEFTYDADGVPAAPVTALAAGSDGVLAVHSLVEALEHGRAALGLRRRRPGAGRLSR